MKKIALLCFFSAVFFLMTCGKSTGPGGGPLFSVKVVDTTGIAAAGLRVGSINHSDNLEKPKPAPKACPTTTIDFNLPVSGQGSLEILNYYGRHIAWVIDGQLVDTGKFSTDWDLVDDDGKPVVSGFYRYRVVVWNDDTISWSDEKWALVEYAPQPTIIGTTDTNGLFATDDTLLFPCLLRQPFPIVRIDPSGEAIDTVYDFYKDTVTITLSDPAEPDKFMYFERALIIGENYFQLTWDPTQTH